MPIYEYVCPGCSHKFELKQSMKDEAVAACERCGTFASRIISSPAIMFKGSGWYVTDYSDKMKPPAGESSSTPAATEKTETAAGSTSAPPVAAPVAAAAASPSTGSASTGSPASSSTPSSSGKASGST